MKKIIHISDIHFGREDAAVLGHLTDKIHEIFPDILIFSGDLTQRARREEFIKARQFLDLFDIPIIVVPGNHDVPMYNFFKRFFNPLKRYTTHITADLFPFYKDDEIAVLGLNTARSMTIKGGRINSEQMTEIIRRMKDLPEHLIKMLVTHHPFDVPEGRDEDDIVQNADIVMQAIDSCNIDVLMAGHLHLSNISKSTRRYKTDSGRNILIVQAGTAASTRVRGEVNSFNLLELNNGDIAVSRFDHDLDKADFQLKESTHFTRSEKGWAKTLHRAI